MPDVLEVVKNVAQSFIDEEPKSPLHVGEVMSCWSFLASAAEYQVHSKAGINSTTDPELSRALHEAVQMFESQRERLIAFFTIRGSFLAPA